MRTDSPTAGGAPLTWVYTYMGHRLTQVCDAGQTPYCTRYDAQAGSPYRSVVADDNPRAYWRLGESSPSAGAASVTARKPGADMGTYTGVVLGGGGALAGTADTAAAFDGATSRVALPEKLTS